MKGNVKQLLTIALVLFSAVFAFAQVKTYSGTVVGADGTALPGVNVKVVGTAKGTSADFDGNFTISAEKGQKLQFSFVGYKDKDVTLGDVTTLNIQMEEDASVLDDVVIVAYGTAKKKDLTGAITTVTSKDIENRQVSTVTRTLEGQVAGLTVTSSTGQPGTDATIRLRGVGSMYSDDTALILLDGVPYPSNLSTINPDDIESVTVLKDAASTALYGSRAANGIVAVTTKRGRTAAKSQISFTARTGWNEAGDQFYDVIDNPAQQYELTWQALKMYYYLNTGQWNTTAGTFASQNLLGILGYNAFKLPEGARYLVDPTTGKIVEGAQQLYSTNWRDELYSRNVRHDYNVSVRGGGDKTSYYMSLGYLSDPSYVVNSSFERFSARMTVDTHVTNWLKAGGGFSYTHRVSNFPPYGQDASLSSNNLFAFAKMFSTIYPVYALDKDGNIKYDEEGNKMYDYGSGQTDRAIAMGNRPVWAGYNPLTYMTKDKFEDKYDNINANVYAEAKFLRDFTFKATFDMNNVQGKSMTFQNNEEGIASQPSLNGYLYKSSSETLTLNANQTLTWSREFGKHHVDVLVGHEYYYAKSSSLGAGMINMLIPGITEFSNFITADGEPSSYTNAIALESYFGRAQYNYDNKYYVSASLRTDGTSKFRYDKWGTFWSVGASWRIAEENWMQNAAWVNELKVRASVGTSGNQEVFSNYPYTDLWSVSNNNGKFAIAQSQTGNPSLTWESVFTIDAGLDFRLWNKFHGSIDYYRRDTNDLIFPVKQAASTGRSSRYENSGKLRNSGIEIDLNYDIFNTQKLYWSVNFNGAHNKQQILSLPDYLMEALNGEGYVNGSYLWKIGKDMYNIYYGSGAGIDPETGYLTYWYEDPVDGVTKRTSDYSKQTKYEQGSSLPDFQGGFNTTFRYAGFDLSISTTFSLGGYAQDSSYLNYTWYGFVPRGWNLHKDLLDSWTPDNTDASMPFLSYGIDSQPGQDFSTQFISKSYFNIKNITVGYTVPASVTNKIGMSTLRVFASCENPWFVSARKGFDPRTSISPSSSANFAGYSQMRTVTFGLNVNF